MKSIVSIAKLCLLLFCAMPLLVLAQAEDKDIPKIDWDALQKTKSWTASEKWTPEPPKVNPGVFTAPPSDAVVLFDGKNLDQWQHPKYGYGARMDEVEAILKARLERQTYTPAEWTVKDGAMVVKPSKGAIETKQTFGSVQLHIEWLSPEDAGKEGQQYSNSGVFLMGLYEIQVLNSYENKTYSNGQAGAVYKQHIPLVNASRPPGEWQAYDIVFNAPKFDEEGKLLKAATLTVFHNGVLIQNNVPVKGLCVFIGDTHYIPHPEKMPLILQDHGDKVRFRNIWVREL